MAWEQAPTKYGIMFGFEGDASRNVTAEPGELEAEPAVGVRWMMTVQVAVNDTIADKLINCTLVKLTAIGE